MAELTPQEHFDRAREYQERYQDAMNEIGIRIPSPVLGQTTNEYRRKTLHALQQALLKNPTYELKSDRFAVADACKFAGVDPRKIIPDDPDTPDQLQAMAKVSIHDLPSDGLKALEPQMLDTFKVARVDPRNVLPGKLKKIKVSNPQNTDHGINQKETRYIGAWDPVQRTQESFVKHLPEYRPGRRVVNFFRSAVEPILARREIA
jgi:hypothetical protein